MPINKSEIFKELVWDNLVAALLSELWLVAPYLAWGPLPAIITFIVAKITDRLYAIAELAVEIEVIVLRNEAHRRAFDVASAKLQILAHDKGIDSKEFKDARADHKKALSQFVRFGAA